MAGEREPTKQPDEAARLRKTRLGELFRERREPGRAGLPTMSVTMAGGIVERGSLDRRVLSDLRPEQHLLARKGDIAYNMMRMWQGVSGLVPYDCVVSPAYVVLEPLAGIVPEFAAYFLKSELTVRKLHRYSQGLTGDRLRLYYEQFKGIVVEVPNTKTQALAAQILQSVDHCIGDSTATYDQLIRVKSALLQDLFDTRRQRSKRNTTRRLRLRDLGRWFHGGTPSKSHDGFWEGTIPWVSAKDLKGPDLWDSQDHISESAVEAGAKLAPVGTILILVRGMGLAKSIPAGIARVPLAFNQDIKGLQLHPDHVPEYVLYWIQRNEGRLMRIADDASHGTKKLDSNELLSLQIEMPHRPEQERVANVLRSVDDRATQERSLLHSLRRLKVALMQGFLTGEIPVSIPAAKLAASQGRDARKARKD